MTLLFRTRGPIRIWLVAPLALLAGACAPLPPAQPEPRPAEALLAYAERLGQLGPQELRQEYEALPGRPDADAIRDLRLALLLAAPATPFRDEAAALRLVQEWERRHPPGQPGVDPALRGFVRLQRVALAERARLQGGLEGAQGRLREEQKRAESCQEKLDALRNLEKTLLERDKR